MKESLLIHPLIMMLIYHFNLSICLCCRISELVVHRQMAPWLHRYFIYKLTPSGREQAQVLKTLHGFTEKV